MQSNFTAVKNVIKYYSTRVRHALYKDDMIKHSPLSMVLHLMSTSNRKQQAMPNIVNVGLKFMNSKMSL
jgi:hypothetical protein